MEHAIGKKITLGVVESKDDKCDGCYFDGFICNKPKDWICHSRDRKDGKNIIYKEVK